MDQQRTGKATAYPFVPQSHKSAQSSEPVTLVTKDLNLRIKADVLGIRAEDFYNDKVDSDQFSSGVGEAYRGSS